MFDDFRQSLEVNPLPLEFGNSLTTSEFLQELFSYIKNNIDKIDKHSIELRNEFENRFNELIKEFDNKTSDKELLRRFERTIKEFCIENISDLISDSLKYITFELTDDGYLCAVIPEVFASDISFDTIMDINSTNYGKLVIEY